MFENMTYDNILNDMLDRVSNDVDKREGSVIYDALAPCAYQLAQNYYNLDNYINLVFGDTAVGEYLDRIAADHGLTRKAATCSVRKIVTSAAVDIGTRWGLNGTTYKITEMISVNTYQAECEQYGAIGNTYSGKLENIDNVNGATASLTDIIIAGEDEETDDGLRERFYAQVQKTGTSGNIYDYRNWALSVSGCGDARVIPLWNGAGTVKVLVADENMAIDSELPSKVLDYIEKVRPIGAAVTVDNPAGLAVDVTANVKLDGTKKIEDVQTAFTSLLTAYLKDTVFKIYSISYAKIGGLLLSTAGVRDYNTLLVNNGTANITVGDLEIPICGTTALTGVE